MMGKICTHVLPFVDADSLKDVGTPDDALDRFVELIGAFWNENGFGVPGKEGHVLHRELNTVRIPIDDTRYMVRMPFGDTHHVVHTRRPIWCNHPRGVEGFMKLNARVYRVRSFLFSA